MKSVLYVEHANKQVDDKTMVDTAKSIYTAAGYKIKDIKSLDLYAKAEECKVYFVVNAGTESDFRGEFDF